MFNTTSTYMLHYRGNGSGGACLPFDTVSSAVTYAKQMSARSFQIEVRATGKIVLTGERPNCRHRFAFSTDTVMKEV